MSKLATGVGKNDIPEHFLPTTMMTPWTKVKLAIIYYGDY